MKKLLFSAVDMDVGGIETALLTLLNYLADKDYKITLVLEKKQGAFLRDLDSKIRIIEYKPSTCKNVITRKTINFIKRVSFILKYKNKFDFSASFATYSKMASFVARTASKNNVLWAHADYLELFKNDTERVKEFFKNIKYKKFRKVVFVSQNACKSFVKIYPEMKDRVVFCNNFIDYKKIQDLANKPIPIKKETYTFVNVGRHDEQQKRLTRIIEAAKKLKEDNLDFKILFIGEGNDTKIYEKLVYEYNLKDKIEFLGLKKNPYPYMNIADAIILSSDYEGYPVVFLEALILNKPIITTDISDAKKDIDNKYGKVVPKNIEDIYSVMKEFIKDNYNIKEKFDIEKYNKKVIKNIENLIKSK